MKGLLKKRILMYRVNKRQAYPYKQLVEDQDTNIRLVEYNINEGLVEEKNINVQGQKKTRIPIQTAGRRPGYKYTASRIQY